MMDARRRGGFRRILLRSNADYQQTEHLDHWGAGKASASSSAMIVDSDLQELAERFFVITWQKLQRPPRCWGRDATASTPRQRQG